MPHDILSIENHPLDGWLRPGDAELLRKIQASSVPLGDVAEVDTGVVVHGVEHRREDLVSDDPSPGAVRYVDAADLTSGRTRYLTYRPQLMHRPKRPELFSGPKVLVMRIRGGHGIRAWIDESGLVAGHTLNIVKPLGVVSASRLHSFLTLPAVLGVLRLIHGDRLDVYPAALRGLPFPKAWLERSDLTLYEAWGLGPVESDRVAAAGAQP
jgi:hypothetical protein